MLNRLNLILQFMCGQTDSNGRMVYTIVWIVIKKTSTNKSKKNQTFKINSCFFSFTSYVYTLTRITVGSQSVSSVTTACVLIAVSWYTHLITPTITARIVNFYCYKQKQIFFNIKTFYFGIVGNLKAQGMIKGVLAPFPDKFIYRLLIAFV